QVHRHTRTHTHTHTHTHVHTHTNTHTKTHTHTHTHTNTRTHTHKHTHTHTRTHTKDMHENRTLTMQCSSKQMKVDIKPLDIKSTPSKHYMVYDYNKGFHVSGKFCNVYALVS